VEPALWVQRVADGQVLHAMKQEQFRKHRETELERVESEVRHNPSSQFCTHGFHVLQLHGRSSHGCLQAAVRVKQLKMAQPAAVGQRPRRAAAERQRSKPAEERPTALLLSVAAAVLPHEGCRMGKGTHAEEENLHANSIVRRIP